MSELSTYSGGCHCGKVRYRVNIDLSKPVLACNCSICSRSGYLLTFVPAGEFTLLSGEEVLTDYVFGHKRIHHLFCSACGVRSFGRGTMRDGSEMRAINVRCLDDIDVEPLAVKKVDGKSLPRPD